MEIKKTKVILHGTLAEIAGGEIHYFYVNTPAEVIRALTANFDGFKQELLKDDAYSVVVDNTPITENELLDPTSMGTVEIIPVIAGSGKFGKIILGVALIGASVYLGGIPGVFAGALGESTGALLFTSVLRSVGTSLLFGGISEALQSTNKAEVKESPENNPSYLFNGAINTRGAGHNVPLGYGTLIVGGATISAGIDTVSI